MSKTTFYVTEMITRVWRINASDKDEALSTYDTFGELVGDDESEIVDIQTDNDNEEKT